MLPADCLDQNMPNYTQCAGSDRDLFTGDQWLEGLPNGDHARLDHSENQGRGVPVGRRVPYPLGFASAGKVEPHKWESRILVDSVVCTIADGTPTLAA